MVKPPLEANSCFLFCVAFDWNIMAHSVPRSSISGIRSAAALYPVSSSIDISISTGPMRSIASVPDRNL